MRNCRGNSMIEYALPLGVVFLGTAIVVSFTEMPQQISDMFGRTVSGEQSGETMEVHSLGDIDSSVSGSSSGAASGAASGASVAYGNIDGAFSWPGTDTVQLSTTSISVPQDVDTQGAIGAANMTLAYAETMESLSDGLEESSPEAAQQISAFAEMSRELAETQRDYVESCADGACDAALEEQCMAGLGEAEIALGQLQTTLDSIPADARAIVETLANETLAAGKNMFAEGEDGQVALDPYMEYKALDAQSIARCAAGSCDTPNQQISEYTRMSKDPGRNDRQLMEQKYGADKYKRFQNFEARRSERRMKHALSDNLNDKFKSGDRS